MTSSLFEAQKDLRQRYKQEPSSALVTDAACTGGWDLADPFHSLVQPLNSGAAAIPVGVHSGVGGPYDAACPGDLLCAALAACQDSSIRLVANLMGVELTALSVRVKATADLRGAMGIDPEVPVAFQSITCEVHMKARDGTPTELLDKLRVAAQRCCVVGQTLLSPPTLHTTFHT